MLSDRRSGSRDLGVKVRTEIAFGNPVEAVLMMLSEQDIDLVVMATHGRTGLRHIMLGSVARDLVRQTQRPMLLGRPTSASTPIDQRGWTRAEQKPAAATQDA